MPIAVCIACALSAAPLLPQTDVPENNTVAEKQLGLVEPCNSQEMKSKLLDIKKRTCPPSPTPAPPGPPTPTPVPCTGCYNVPMPECCRNLKFFPNEAIRFSLDKSKYKRFLYELAMPAFGGVGMGSSIKTLHKLDINNVLSYEAHALNGHGVHLPNAFVAGTDGKKSLGYYVWMDETHFIVTRHSAASLLDDAVVKVFLRVADPLTTTVEHLEL